jgi:ArsR family transcriptional regulator
MREVAQFFKVLSDEARLKIMWLLFNNRELCVCDLMEALGITQSKASRHLGMLRVAGLVSDRREGTWSYYSIRQAPGDLQRAVFDSLRAGLADHPAAAGVLLDLRAWLARKDRGAACAARRACKTPTVGRKRGSDRVRKGRPDGR